MQLLDGNVSEVFAISIVCYVALVLIIYAFLKCLKPDLFINTGDNEVEGLQYGHSKLVDCSFVYNCCPCRTVSFRQCLRKLNCGAGCRFKELANCECIRPAIQGNTPYRVDFVCCRV